MLCEAARDNLKRNGAHNAVVIHSPSEKVARGLLRRKTRKPRKAVSEEREEEEGRENTLPAMR